MMFFFISPKYPLLTRVQAVESDTAGEYEKAYQLYYQACETGTPL